MTTTTHANLIGRTVNYSGDMANAPRTGIVSEIVSDQFSTEAVILWDEDENTGWDDGEAVSYYQPASRIAVHLLKEADESTPSDRYTIS